MEATGMSGRSTWARARRPDSSGAENTPTGSVRGLQSSSERAHGGDGRSGRGTVPQHLASGDAALLVLLVVGHGEGSPELPGVVAGVLRHDVEQSPYALIDIEQ